MSKLAITLHNPIQARPPMTALWGWITSKTLAGHRVHVVAKTETRTIKQNKMMWSCLTDLSKQVQWFGKRMTPEGWKNWITGHLNGQELHPNMDGTGFISVTKGSSTSDMTIPEMIAVIDLCHAFGADKGIQWSKTSLGRDEFVDVETGEIYA